MAAVIHSNKRPRRLWKAEALVRWRTLPDDLNPAAVVRPIPYGHQGPTFAQDGIRITGSREFVDAVLSKLKDMLGLENDSLRLGINYQESVDRQTLEPTGSWTCYIQVHERAGKRPGVEGG